MPQSFTNRGENIGTSRSYQGQKKQYKLQKNKHSPRIKHTVNRCGNLRSFRRQHSTLAIRHRTKSSGEEEARRISPKPKSHRASTSCNHCLCRRKTRIDGLQHLRQNTILPARYCCGSSKHSAYCLFFWAKNLLNRSFQRRGSKRSHKRS